MQNSNSVDKNLKDFEALLYKCTCPHNPDKNNPEALSQLYKMMNYKPTSSKGEKLTTEQVANFLKVNKKNQGDVYDDIMYYDDAKIKVCNFAKEGTCFETNIPDREGLLRPQRVLPGHQDRQLG